MSCVLGDGCHQMRARGSRGLVEPDRRAGVAVGPRRSITQSVHPGDGSVGHQWALSGSHSQTATLPKWPRTAGRGDWLALRAAGEAALVVLDSLLPEHADIERVDDLATSYDGASVLVRWYRVKGVPPSDAGPAVVYLHGGGMIAGTVELYDRLVAAYVADSGVPILAVDFRRAPEHPHPTPVEDAFAGLAWLHDRAGELGVDPGRIAFMGDSGGGGLAAGAALLARDRGLSVARQILIYPMLDDRNTVPDPALLPFVGSHFDDNFTRWQALLGDSAGGPDVPSVAAPARALDLSGLPATYVEVGELDIFRDESIEYARRLAVAGTSVELHVHRGCIHGFDRVGAGTDVVRRSRADRVRFLQRL